MRRSISNNLAILVLAPLLSSTPTKAEEPVFIDDAALKRTFERKLTALLEEGDVPSASEIRGSLGKDSARPIELGTREGTRPPDSNKPFYENARASTLMLGHLYKCGKCDRWHGSLAGGVIIGEGGIAVTNYHVIDSEAARVFGAMDHEENIYPVTEILASSKKDDLAIVRLGNCQLPPVPFGKPASAGDAVHVLSHPDGHFYTYTKGVVSRYYLLGSDKARRMQISADFARGSSGSGAFSDEGKLTGIIASTNSIYYKQREGEDENLQMVVKTCIPIVQLQSLLSGRSTAAD